MFCLQFFSFEIRLDVTTSELRLLKRQLSRAGERRRRIRIESDIAERENVVVLRQLQSRFRRSAAPRLFFSTSSCSISGLIFTPPVHTTPAVFNALLIPLML